MSSKVQICNYALSILGASRITSLSDNTTEANLCNTLIDDVIDEVLVEGPWAFATRRAELNVTTTTPEFEYSYEFQLPTNPLCLKVLNINETDPGYTDYRIEADKLLADVSTMKIRYIGRITDTQSFSPMFERALKTKMASLMAYALTGNGQMVATLQDLYERQVRDGLSVDGQQGSKTELISPDLHDVR